MVERIAAWKVNLPKDDADALLRSVMVVLDLDPTGPPCSIDGVSKRSLRRNRWAAQLHADISPAGPSGSTVAWLVEMAGDKHDVILAEIANAFPPGSVAVAGDSAAGGAPKAAHDERLQDADPAQKESEPSASASTDAQMRPDIAAAWALVNNKTGRKRDVKKLPEYLHGGETVLAMTGGITGGKAGLLVATDRRALFVAEGVINHSFEDFPYDRINTVTSTRGMVFGSILINTAGAARVVEQVAKGEAEKVAAILRERVEAVTRERYTQPAVSPPPTAAPAHGIAGELRDLATLRDEGVLTDEEFAAEKARLLGR